MTETILNREIVENKVLKSVEVFFWDCPWPIGVAMLGPMRLALLDYSPDNVGHIMGRSLFALPL